MLARTGRTVWTLGAVAALLSGCASRPARVATAPEPPPIEAPAPQPIAPEPAPTPVPVETRAEVAPPARQVEPSLSSTNTFAERPAEAAAIDTFLAPATADPPPPSPETAKAVVDDLGTRDYDIPIPLNDKVLAFVELFSGRLKNYLEEGLSRGARYLPMVQSIFQAEGLPRDLSYVPLIESAFKPSAVSRAKARGMWQFMRGTALENGLRHDWYLDERADPEKATRAAAKYLKFLHEKFDGDWHLALASYNGGYGRVQRAMKRSGRDDFWELSSTRRHLPRETRDYVPLILAAVIVSRNPTHYGLNVVPAVEVASEVVTVAGPMDLRRVAEWTGTSLEGLQDLNPELRRWTTPVRDDQYSLRVPLGTAEIVRTRAAELTADVPDPFTRHIVKKGETLASVAKKLRVTRADLAEANYLTTRARLTAGQQLIIPKPPALLAGPDAVLAAADTTGAGEELTDAVAAAGPSTPVARAPERRVHRVKSGETLFSIARLYRTTVASIREWNNLRGSTIRVGQRLTIRSAGSQAD
jgi:membrane-bound lytic murein transglycosylase D